MLALKMSTALLLPANIANPSAGSDVPTRLLRATLRAAVDHAPKHKEEVTVKTLLADANVTLLGLLIAT